MAFGWLCLLVLARRGRPFHQDVAGPLEVLDQPFGRDARHGVVGVVDALATGEAQREGQGLLDLLRGGGAQSSLSSSLIEQMKLP